MTGRKTRKLRPDEEELWERVRHTTVPMHKSARKIVKEAVEGPKPKIKPARQAVPQFTIGQTAASTAMPLGTSSASRSNDPVLMDQKSYSKLKRGKVSPERRIDLHGMTLDQAHPALNRFVLDAHADGLRLVLVITGKGKLAKDDYAPKHRGVLKRQVPQWLRAGLLKPLVLQVSESHQRHGGEGAYYVYLRRQR